MSPTTHSNFDGSGIIPLSDSRSNKQLHGSRESSNLNIAPTFEFPLRHSSIANDQTPLWSRFWNHITRIDSAGSCSIVFKKYRSIDSKIRKELSVSFKLLWILERMVFRAGWTIVGCCPGMENRVSELLLLATIWDWRSYNCVHTSWYQAIFDSLRALLTSLSLLDSGISVPCPSSGKRAWLFFLCFKGDGSFKHGARRSLLEQFSQGSAGSENLHWD